MARKYDPQGNRTIGRTFVLIVTVKVSHRYTPGVLTKPDRIAPRSEDLWTRYIRNEEEPLRHNWYCVKQPNAFEMERGITWEDARFNEEHFFQKVEPWESIESTHRLYLTSKNLVRKMNLVLSDLAMKRCANPFLTPNHLSNSSVQNSPTNRGGRSAHPRHH